MKKMVLLGVGLAGILACSSPPQELRLGVISYKLPENNPQSHLEGYSTDKATELAVEEINKAGGIPLDGRRVKIRVFHEAIPETAEDAVGAVQYLVNREKVSVILGPSMSAQAVAAGGAAEAAHVPLITSVSSNPRTTEGRKFVFRMCSLNAVQSKALTRFAVEHLHSARPLIVYDEADSYSANVASQLEKAWQERLGQFPPSVKLTLDLPDIVKPLRQVDLSKADLVIIPTSSDLALRAATALRSLGYKGLFLGGDGWDREAFRRLPIFEGSYMGTNYVSTQISPQNQKFVQAYQALAGRIPGDTAALTYDSVYLVARAVTEAASVDPIKVRDSILRIPLFEGVVGSLHFPGDGDPDRSFIIIRFSGGDYQFAAEVMP